MLTIGNPGNNFQIYKGADNLSDLPPYNSRLPCECFLEYHLRKYCKSHQPLFYRDPAILPYRRPVIMPTEPNKLPPMIPFWREA